MKDNLLWRVARAMHNEDDPLCDWSRLPDEDTSYGIGKTRRLLHAQSALAEVGRALGEASLSSLLGDDK